MSAKQVDRADSIASTNSGDLSVPSVDRYGPYKALANIFTLKAKPISVERHAVQLQEVPAGRGARGSMSSTVSVGGGGRGRGGGRGGSGGGMGRGRGRGVVETAAPLRFSSTIGFPNKAVCREVMQKAMNNKKFWCYDDQGILLHSKQIGYEGIVKLPTTKRSYQLKITWQGSVTLDFHEKKHNPEVDQLCNIIWHEAVSAKCAQKIKEMYLPSIPAKILVFPKSCSQNLKGKVIRIGVFQCVHMIAKLKNDQLEQEPVLCLNVQGAVGIMPQPLSGYLVAVTGGLPTNNLAKEAKAKSPVIFDALKAVEGLKITVRHSSDDGSQRSKKVFALLLGENSRTWTFETKGRKFTLEQYYKEVCGVTLQHPLWPVVCLNKKKTMAAPLEFCDVVAQTDPQKRRTLSERAEIVNLLAMSPGKRKELIQFFADDLYPSSEILQHYKLMTSTKMRSIEAEVLPPPKIAYGHSSIKSVEKGAWHLGDSQFLRPGSLNRWCVFYSDRLHSNETSRIQPFLTELTSRAKRRGLLLAKPFKVEPFSEQTLEKSLFADLFKNHSNAEFALFILHSSQTHVRAEVKRIFEEFIPTGHLIAQHTPILNSKMPNSESHFDNILAKINCKTQGGSLNHQVIEESATDNAADLSPGSPSSLGRVLAMGCAVIGVDVCHPGNGGSRSLLPSLVGMVVSWSKDMTRWTTAIRAQPPLSEVIDCTKALLTDAFAPLNPEDYPEKLIYIRDGISEGQFDKVLSVEVPGLLDVYLSRGRPLPHVAVVTVSKRTKVRLFPSDHQMDKMNVPPGLVVFNDILCPSWMDYPNFFLVSHAGIKGTSNPCRYHILKDEIFIKLSGDGIADRQRQVRFWARLLYDMCHSYQRCPRAVSIPAPAYYAHLVADRARSLAQKITHRVFGVGMLPTEDAPPPSTEPPTVVTPAKQSAVRKQMNDMFSMVCQSQGERLFFL